MSEIHTEKTEQTVRTRDGRYWSLVEGTKDTPTIKLCAPGGGFVFTVESSKVTEWNTTVPTRMRFVSVGFDDDEHAMCKAYVDLNRRWNGWLWPLVDRENLEKLVARFNALHAEEQSNITMAMDGDALIVTHDNEEEDQRVEPEMLEWEGKQIQVWDVSLGLVWDHVGAPFRPGLNVVEVAVAFAEEMRERLSAAQLREVNRKNLLETDPIVCHSHDYCDANMVMHEAFMRFDVNMSENSTEESTAFWGAVWDLAMWNQFDPEMIRASK